MYDDTLEYSYSGGTYWSKYNHCRVWENDTYEVIVRDQYGQTATTQVEVTNNTVRELSAPVIDSNGYEEGVWTSEDVVLTVTSPDSDVSIYYSANQGTSWTLLSGDLTLSSTQSLMFQAWDTSGNQSHTSTFRANIDKTAPTNLNFVPVVQVGVIIYTEVSAIDNDSSVTYSITYDGGETWSSPQIGQVFKYFYAPVGTYSVNCRAYNSAGLYTEGTPISITIS